MQRRTCNGIIAMSFGACLALSSGQASAYVQTNLVSDIPGLALNTDPDLINPWGMSTGGGPIWVSDNGTDRSTLYNAAGQKQSLVVSIPSGAPDGQVFNPNTSDFLGAHFVFASENGGIDAWSGGSSAVNRVGVSTSAVYKGLAIGTSSQGATLYAANFRAGTIDVFNSTFGKVSLAGSFTDPNGIPAGYAPFNVQNIGGKLYVTYAVQDSAKHDDVAGAGHGIVDVFDTNGNFLQRLASNGAGSALDSPWGLAMAPSNFGKFSNDLLVGNFGDGMINAFDPTTGAFLGFLTDASGNPIVIQGLWGLMFGGGTSANGATNELFFAAGIPLPGDTVLEDHGLFGALTVPEPSTLALLAPGAVLLSLRRRRRT
jgi:uncharacterized protein (TIGR03118 family)